MITIPNCIATVVFAFYLHLFGYLVFLIGREAVDSSPATLCFLLSLAKTRIGILAFCWRSNLVALGGVPRVSLLFIFALLSVSGLAGLLAWVKNLSGRKSFILLLSFGREYLAGRKSKIWDLVLTGCKPLYLL